MSKLTLTAVLSVLFATFAFPVFGAVPEYYSILAEPIPLDQVTFTPSPKASPWKPSQADIKRGFAAYGVDTADVLTPDWLWTEPAPPASIDLFVYKGQFRPAPLAIRTLQPLNNMRIVCSELKNSKGGIIPKEYTDIRSVVYIARTVDKQVLYTGTWLRKQLPSKLPKEYTSWVWITFHADSKTQPGVYKGVITVSGSGNGKQTIPVKVLVPGFNIQPPKGSYGYYIPGHFNMVTQGVFHNYAEPQYIPANIGTYFKFWKTRNLTSPTFYHMYPGLSCIDGHAQTDFTDLGKMVNAVKKAGLKGDVCVDLRWIEWWASTAAGVLDTITAAGKSTAGDIGIHGQDGWQAETYSEGSKRLVTEAAQQLIDKANKEKWPRLLLLAEEELAGDLLKRAAWEAFTPVLRKLAPDTTYIVDNSIGYSGMSTDRGEINNIRIRQYNNWTEEGLAAAKRQGAQVRSYNYGWSRCTWGFLQTRLGSDSHHQWADMWYGGNAEASWSVTQLSSKGITTSVPAETSHEGLDDIAYTQTLLALSGKKGPKYLANAKKLIDSLISDVPVNSMIYHPWLSYIPNTEFERRRWEMALAIDGLSGKKNYTKGAPGKPKILGTWPVRLEVKKPDKIVGAPRISEKMTLDGNRTERCWSYPGSGTGPLRWLWNTEAQMLAAAGAQGRDTIAQPSSTNAYVAYDSEGIYLLAQCNHTTLENARIKHGDNDPELWMDDCMEFFFEPKFGSNEYYHLTVNVKGNSLLVYRSDVIQDPGIKTAQVNLNNGSGGYSQEIFVPWKSLGLSEMPKQGTAWRMNIAREFNSWDQLMSWGTVNSMFAETDRWGMLVFEGEQGKVSLENLMIGPGFPGKNSVSGQIVSAPAWTPTDMVVSVTDTSSKTVASQNISLEKWKANPAFSITFSVPQNITAQTWQLKITDLSGAILGTAPIPVRSEKSSVTMVKCPTKVIGGTNMAAEIRLNIGDISLKESSLAGTLKSSAGQIIPLPACKLQGSDTQKVWIATNGLQPGVWSLQLGVSGTTNKGTVTKFTVLPCPTAE